MLLLWKNGSAPCELEGSRKSTMEKLLLCWTTCKTNLWADSLFYHAVQLDAEDKAANDFWADAKMVVDLGQFGDVISFDISSMDNMNLRPFASFVGFNNYGESILLGMAFMYDDTLESFQWLFDTFLNAMSGRAPKIIFSHQDATITEAISSVMPCLTHAMLYAHCTLSRLQK
jgi:hypothetical protein